MADISLLSPGTIHQSMFGTQRNAILVCFNEGIPLILNFLKFYKPYGNPTEQFIRNAKVIVQINDHPNCIIFSAGAVVVRVDPVTMKIILVGCDNDAVHLNESGVFYEKFMTYEEFEPFVFQLSTITTDGIDMDIFNQIIEYNKGLK